MPNYSFVIDSSFEPMSFKDRLAPFLIAKEAYDKDMETLTSLYDKTDPFSYLDEGLDAERDQKARGIYDKYVGDLRDAATRMNTEGMTIGNRRNILNIRRRYAGEIGRLEKADANRKLDIEEQKKLYLQDPTRMFSKEASTTSLDDYLNGQRMPYQSYSGALLAQQVGTAATALSKSLTDFGNGKALDNYTKTWIEQHGFTPSQVMQAINNPTDPSSSPVLRTLVDSTIASSGIPQWGDTATVNRARQYAVQGLWNAVGQTAVHSYDDYGAKLAADEASKKRLIDYKAQADAAALQQQRQLSLGEPDSEALTVFNNADNEALNKYFMKGNNGRLVMKGNTGLSEQFGGVSPFIYDRKDKKWRYKTESEMSSSLTSKYGRTGEAYSGNPIIANSQMGIAGSGYTDNVSASALQNYKEFLGLMKGAGVDTNSYRFSSKLDKHGTPMFSTNTNDNINSVYLDNTPNGYVDVGLTRMRLNDTASTAVKNFLVTHPDGVREIKNVTSRSGARTYNTGNAIDADDLKKNGTVSDLLYDSGSNQIIATIGDKRYTVPIGILPLDEQQNIKRYGQYLNMAVTDAQKAKAQSLISNSLQRALQVYGTHNSTESDYNYKK